jgi:tetratricopeptide (TPR) repeat protein
MFEAGAALYREQKHAEALALFLELARENNRFGGVLGMIVANLAPTKPDSAKVAEYVAAAEAAPDDLLSQYVAGVAAHYSAHYIASTHEEKRRLYTICIRFLDKTRPTLEFEPRVFIYLAVSHYRLGHQAEAEPLIEEAVTIAKYDPDAYYCRAEIFHRTDVARSLDDLETYLIMTRKFAEAGGWAADEKIQRVQAMRDYLKRVQAGDAALAEIFDPLASDTPGTVAPHVPVPAKPSEAAQALAKPQVFGRWVGLVGVLAALVLGLGLWLQRRRDSAPPNVS